MWIFLGWSSRSKIWSISSLRIKYFEIPFFMTCGSLFENTCLKKKREYIMMHPFIVKGMDFETTRLKIFIDFYLLGFSDNCFHLYCYFPERFGRYVLRPSSGVCRTREPSRNFELRRLLNPRESLTLIPLPITGVQVLVFLYWLELLQLGMIFFTRAHIHFLKYEHR